MDNNNNASSLTMEITFQSLEASIQYTVTLFGEDTYRTFLQVAVVLGSFLQRQTSPQGSPHDKVELAAMALQYWRNRNVITPFLASRLMEHFLGFYHPRGPLDAATTSMVAVLPGQEQQQQQRHDYLLQRQTQLQQNQHPQQPQQPWRQPLQQQQESLSTAASLGPVSSRSPVLPPRRDRGQQQQQRSVIDLTPGTKMIPNPNGEPNIPGTNTMAMPNTSDVHNKIVKAENDGMALHNDDGKTSKYFKKKRAHRSPSNREQKKKSDNRAVPASKKVRPNVLRDILPSNGQTNVSTIEPRLLEATHPSKDPLVKPSKKNKSTNVEAPVGDENSMMAQPLRRNTESEATTKETKTTKKPPANTSTKATKRVPPHSEESSRLQTAPATSVKRPAMKVGDSAGATALVIPVATTCSMASRVIDLLLSNQLSLSTKDAIADAFNDWRVSERDLSSSADAVQAAQTALQQARQDHQKHRAAHDKAYATLLQRTNVHTDGGGGQKENQQTSQSLINEN